MTDEPNDPTVVAFPKPQPPPFDAMKERGARPPVLPPPEPPPASDTGLRLTPLQPPEPGPAMPLPPRPPQNRAGVGVDQVAAGTCHLCDQPSGEKMLLVTYQATPLIGVRIAICLSCLRALVLNELDKRRKHAENARKAEYEAEDRKYGFSKRERRALELQGWFSSSPRKVSAEFIDAAVVLAGQLRNDWYSGRTRGLSHLTLQALGELLEACGAR
jgi:hypothetical protein